MKITQLFKFSRIFEAPQFSCAEVEMARLTRFINFSTNLKLLAKRTFNPAAKCHYSVCMLCENNLLNESSRVLAVNNRKCK